MQKIQAGSMVMSVLGRMVHPSHVTRAIKLQINRKANRRRYDDQQLALYSQILPSDFLHFGYFDDPGTPGDEVSLADIVRAQDRYAEVLCGHVTDRDAPVLDVGCGMGGLCRMLRERGFAPEALSPDRMQIANITQRFGGEVPAHKCKFEQFDAAGREGKYGTIITSESLQYLKLDKALPLIAKLLAGGGKWIASDWFRIDGERDKSCHDWAEFNEKVKSQGWTIAHEQDITPNVMPMLRCLTMLGARFGIPLMHFSFLKLRKKQPALHHLMENVLKQLEAVARDNLKLVDPELFAATKRYTLLVLEHGVESAA